MEQKQQISVFSMSPDQWTQYLSPLGHKSYRGRQIRQWIYEKMASSFDEMTDLPQNLRSVLSPLFLFQQLEVVERKKSRVDGSEKFLWRIFHKGLPFLLESVLIYANDRVTACISSQVGCRVGCSFCGTADVHPVLHLPEWAIIEQYWAMRKLAGLEKIDNIVYMGMGEPMHNYNAVIRSAYRFTEHPGFFLHPKRITISSSGILPMLNRYLIEGHPFRVAISLNAANSQTRRLLIPHEGRWPINELTSFAQKFYDKHHKRVTFEYVLMRGVNDSPEDARLLGELFARIPAKVNVIPFNENNKGFGAPEEEQIDRFLQAYLDVSPIGKRRKSPITLRRSAGSDISSACGQLAGQYAE